MSGIWLVIKEAATSKKFIMSVAGTITAYLLKVGLDLPIESVAAIISPIVAYILGQGWADTGKEAAKVEAIAEVMSSGQTHQTATEKVETIQNV